MSDPFIGEIQAFAITYPPKGWAICNGALLPIRSNTPLYSLLGTQFGGDGTTTFGLPNLVGRVAISQGQGPGLQNYQIGENVGEASVTLSTPEIPIHAHNMQLGNGTITGGTAGPSATSNVAIDPSFNGFVAGPGNTSFSPGAILPSGGSQAHANAQPTLALIYCIALDGIFPSFN